MHHEAYVAKGEFGEFTLARDRRLRRYLVTKCFGTLEVTLTLTFAP